MLQNLKNLWAKAKAWWAGVLNLAKQDVASIWASTKAFIIPIVILGVVIKFRDIIISILVNSGKRIYQKAQQQDQTLQNNENKANQQANTLVQQADNLPNTEKPVDENWYKDQK